MAVTLTQAMLALSNLMGEQTVPTTGVDDRQNFIQRTLEEIYRRFPFELNKVTATISLISGVASLPSNVKQDPYLDVRVVNSGSTDDYVFKQVPFDQQDNYVQGDYGYWLTGYQSAYLLNSKDADATLQIRYTSEVPTINASIPTPFPDANIIAMGALRYVRLGENPFADVTQEEDLFQIRLDEFIANMQMTKPQRRFRSVGGNIGEV